MRNKIEEILFDVKDGKTSVGVAEELIITLIARKLFENQMEALKELE